MLYEVITVAEGVGADRVDFDRRTLDRNVIGICAAGGRDAGGGDRAAGRDVDVAVRVGDAGQQDAAATSVV